MLTENQAAVANTILNQIGKKALFMIGAKGIVFYSEGFGGMAFKTMRVPSSYANHIKIMLDEDDTYTMKFSRMWGLSRKLICEEKGVYCDMLHLMIEKYTGLTTTLPTVFRKH